ncbi:MAG TPA: hypothetical protein VJO16_20055 [Candidatus Acidoferrum sp.]|nr:hypothetical protein [Candidatus Acidoferrum sp.]
MVLPGEEAQKELATHGFASRAGVWLEAHPNGAHCNELAAGFQGTVWDRGNREQTILVVSDDAALCAAARREFEASIAGLLPCQA